MKQDFQLRKHWRPVILARDGACISCGCVNPRLLEIAPDLWSSGLPQQRWLRLQFLRITGHEFELQLRLPLGGVSMAIADQVRGRGIRIVRGRQ